MSSPAWELRTDPYMAYKSEDRRSLRLCGHLWSCVQRCGYELRAYHSSLWQRNVD